MKLQFNIWSDLNAGDRKRKMAAGELYNPEDQQLLLERKHARQLIRQYNETPEDDAVRTELLKELLGSVGDQVTILPTFRCDYGYHIHIGDQTFVNFDCVILDVCEVRIGRHCLIALRCTYLHGRPSSRSD